MPGRVGEARSRKGGTDGRPDIVAVCDTSDGGHNRLFFREQIRALVGLGYRVIAIAPFAEEELAAVPEAVAGGVMVAAPPRPPRAMGIVRRLFGVGAATRVDIAWRGWRIHRLLRSMVPRGERCFCFFSCIWLRELESDWVWRRQRRFDWGGLIVHLPQFREPSVLNRYPPPLAASMRIDELFSAARCRSIAVLDEAAPGWLSRKTGRPVVVHPDIAEEARSRQGEEEAAEIRRRARGRLIVALVGALSDRKGLADLLLLAERDGGARCYFLVAGESWNLSPSTRQNLEQAAQHGGDHLDVRIQRILDPAVFNAYIEVADLVWCAYRDFPNSSNVQVKAAALGRPCLVSDGYLLAERNRAFGLGPIVAEGDIDGIEAAFREFASAEGMEAWRQATRGAEFAARHHPGRLRGMFEKVLACH